MISLTFVDAAFDISFEVAILRSVTDAQTVKTKSFFLNHLETKRHCHGKKVWTSPKSMSSIAFFARNLFWGITLGSVVVVGGDTDVF